MIKASCHCGNTQIQFKQLPESYTVCNCSICRRYAVKWLYFSVDQVEVREKMVSKRYIWGDKEIAFHHCQKCGCISHYSMIAEGDLDRIAVNGNLLEDCKLLGNLKIRYFDGADY